LQPCHANRVANDRPTDQFVATCRCRVDCPNFVVASVRERSAATTGRSVKSILLRLESTLRRPSWCGTGSLRQVTSPSTGAQIIPSTDSRTTRRPSKRSTHPPGGSRSPAYNATRNRPPRPGTDTPATPHPALRYVARHETRRSPRHAHGTSATRHREGPSREAHPTRPRNDASRPNAAEAGAAPAHPRRIRRAHEIYRSSPPPVTS